MISLLILVLSGVVEPDLQIGLSFSLFLLLGIGVSALAQNSSSALVLLVTSWAMLIVVVPQTSYLIAISMEASTGFYWERMGQLERELRTALQREGVEPRPPRLAKLDGYAVEMRYAQRIQDLEEGKDRILKESINQQVRQFKLARRVNLLSPGFAFQYTVEALLRNGIHRFENFSD